MSEVVAEDDSGIIKRFRKNFWIMSAILVVLIGIATVVMATNELSSMWRAILQTATAVAGAALGNFLRIDIEHNAVRNQARPAVRHLFDQVDRLRQLVRKAEGFQLHSQRAGEKPIDSNRTSDWFEGIGTDLRNEIMATATAIENWSDLAPDVRRDELTNYTNRAARIPSPEPDVTTGERNV